MFREELRVRDRGTKRLGGRRRWKNRERERDSGWESVMEIKRERGRGEKRDSRDSKQSQ